MDFDIPKHNTPSATLVKNYLNKKSGKVVASRREIKSRFNGMDWFYQKKILVAFINGCATDRDWASRKMFAYWDKSFIPIVATMWGKYHEKPLSWLILRYFPKEYLKQYMDELSEGRNYFFLCQRLFGDHDFVVDRERLDEPDLFELHVMAKMPMSDDEIRSLFFTMIRKICKGLYHSTNMNQWYEKGGDASLTMLDNVKVSRVLLGIELDLHKRELADEFRSWSANVMMDIYQSNEYSMIRQMGLSGHDIRGSVISMIKKYCLKHLDNENDSGESSNSVEIHVAPKLKSSRMGASSVLQSMKDNHPEVDNLIEKFSLEIEDPLPF